MDKKEVRLGKKDPLVVGNKVFISFNDWDLTDKEMEKARIELGETEERRKKCLQELKERLSKEGNFRTDDFYLLRYLRAKKFDCDKAFKYVKHLYQLRKNPEFFGDPSNLIHSNSNLFHFLSVFPYTDEERRVIFRISIGKWNLQETSLEEAMQHVAAVLEITSMNPRCQVNGVISVFDGKGLSASHLSALLWKNRYYTLTHIANNALPWRIHKTVIFNTSRLVRFAFMTIRPLLSRKVAERVVLIGSDLNEVHKHINPIILPKEYGGDLEDEECKVLPNIKENIPFIQYERSFSGD